MLLLALICFISCTIALTPELLLHGIQLRLRYHGTDWLSPGGTLDTRGDKYFHSEIFNVIDEK